MPKAKPIAKRPPRRMGRKPDISEAQMVQLETLLGNHTSVKGACVLTGVAEPTYYAWIARADDPASNPIYREFRERMSRAKELGKATLIKSIQDAGTGPEGDWRALAWIGERVYPDDFGPKEKIAHTHSGTVSHEHKTIVYHIPAAIARPRPQRTIEAHKDPEPEKPKP